MSIMFLDCLAPGCILDRRKQYKKQDKLSSRPRYNIYNLEF